MWSYNVFYSERFLPRLADYFFSADIDIFSALYELVHQNALYFVLNVLQHREDKVKT